MRHFSISQKNWHQLLQPITIPTSSNQKSQQRVFYFVQMLAIWTIFISSRLVSWLSFNYSLPPLVLLLFISIYLLSMHNIDRWIIIILFSKIKCKVTTFNPKLPLSVLIITNKNLIIRNQRNHVKRQLLFHLELTSTNKRLINIFRNLKEGKKYMQEAVINTLLIKRLI